MKKIAILLSIAIMFSVLLSSCDELFGFILVYDGQELLDYSEISEIVLDNIDLLETTILLNDDKIEKALQDQLIGDYSIDSVMTYATKPKIIQFQCSTFGNAQNIQISGFYYSENDSPYAFKYTYSERKIIDEEEYLYSIDEPGDFINVKKICAHWWFYYIRDC